jgi:hypothetical protein
LIGGGFGAAIYFLGEVIGDMNGYFVAVDLGQAHDPSTIAVAERAELRGDWDAAQYCWKKVVEVRIRMLDRIPLGTTYPDVVRRVVEVLESPRMAGGKRYLAMDGTGVGRPIVDLLRQARPPATILPVIVTGVGQQTQSNGYYHVPKRDLIAGLQLRFQQGTLRLPKHLLFGDELAGEMRAMERRTTRSGHEQFGAWRTGTHDDLVFAVALANWAENLIHPGKKNEYWLDRREAERAEVFKKAVREEEPQR